MPRALINRYAPALVLSLVLGFIQRLLAEPNIIVALCELAVGWYIAYLVYQDAGEVKAREQRQIVSFWQFGDLMYASAALGAVLNLATFLKTINA